MTQPADTVTKFFRVRDLTTDLLVPSLSLVEGTDFASLGFKHEYGGTPTTYALGSTYTALGSGYYAWTYTKPAAAGHDGQSLLAVSATHAIEIVTITGELEAQDLASLAALVAQPVGGAGTAFSFGSAVPIDRAVYRARTITQAFTGVDLSTSAYDNWQIGIRDKDQTALHWDCGSGKIDGFTITGDAAGLLTIVWPESLIGPVYTTWTTSRAYARGDFVRPTVNNGYCYQVTSAAGTSHAATEPTWPTTVGLTVTDNGITWTCRLRSIWVASAARVVGDMIRPTTPNGFIYRCITAGTSHAATEPTWASLGFAGTVTDGTVVWERQDNPDAHLEAGTDTETVAYEATADALSTAVTQAIIPSSPFNLKRREFGA